MSKETNEKHKKYVDFYIDGKGKDKNKNKDTLYWGIGIENETYIMTKNLTVVDGVFLNNTNKILKQRNNQGYKIVHLNGKYLRVHRLVAEAFIPNPENKPYVDHKNNIRDDNRIDNLRWATIKENNQNVKLLKLSIVI